MELDSPNAATAIPDEVPDLLPQMEKKRKEKQKDVNSHTKQRFRQKASVKNKEYSTHKKPRRKTTKQRKKPSRKNQHTGSRKDCRAFPLVEAAIQGNYSLVDKLLCNDKVDVNQKDRASTTALIAASSKNYVDIVKRLLNDNKCDVNWIDRYNNTALLIATKRNFVDLVRVLINDNRCNLNISEGLTYHPLLIAADGGNTELVKIFINNESCDTNTKDSQNRRALPLAAAKGHREIVECLLNYQKCDVNQKGYFSRTALMEAVQNNDPNIVQLLLQDKRCDVNEIDAKHRSALTIACENNRFCDATCYSNIVARKTDNPSSMELLYDKVCHSHKIVAMILEHGQCDINLQDNEAQTALIVATRHGNQCAVALLLQDMNCNSNIKDKFSLTAFDYSKILENAVIKDLLQIALERKLHHRKDYQSATGFSSSVDSDSLNTSENGYSADYESDEKSRRSEEIKRLRRHVIKRDHRRSVSERNRRTPVPILYDTDGLCKLTSCDSSLGSQQKDISLDSPLLHIRYLELPDSSSYLSAYVPQDDTDLSCMLTSLDSSSGSPLKDISLDSPLLKLETEPSDAEANCSDNVLKFCVPPSSDSDHLPKAWCDVLIQNCEAFQDLLTVRIVIDFMKHEISSKHMRNLEQIKKDWQKIEYFIKFILIDGSTNMLNTFKQALIETDQRDLIDLLPKECESQISLNLCTSEILMYSHNTVTNRTGGTLENMSKKEMDSTQSMTTSTELPNNGMSQTIAKRDKEMEDMIATFYAKMRVINQSDNLDNCGIYAIQFVESIPTIMVFCHRDEECQARDFAIDQFGKTAFTLCPTDSRPTLLTCSFCGDPLCPSKTGYQNDKACRAWVGPGSPILGLTKLMWERIQNNLNGPKTLEDVIKCHKQIAANENVGKPFMEYWSIGCFASQLPDTKEEVILTAAHPLEGSDKSNPAPPDALIDSDSSPVVFLTQIRINEQDMVKVLGYASRGAYSKRLGIDFLKIHPCNEIKIYMSSKIKATCRSRYINVEPCFEMNPEFERNVTKRGSTTGNTFGLVCTKGHLFMLIRTVKRKADGSIKREIYRYVDAFAVCNAETECMEKRLFADRGDSGSVIFDSAKQPNNEGNERNAYGIVWQTLTIHNEINDKQSEETICCKINKCVDYLNCRISREDMC